jgi:hypothetical protein
MISVDARCACPVVENTVSGGWDRGLGALPLDARRTRAVIEDNTVVRVTVDARRTVAVVQENAIFHSTITKTP